MLYTKVPRWIYTEVPLRSMQFWYLMVSQSDCEAWRPQQANRTAISERYSG
ncbi:hypothetical protein ACL6C3_14055 [Capilliphycus salinus ALCB114379]|uniref:hypothetical protein n=1 Tax=Capilliphycus salinus TaxID=2768948 RepID=UPI0039A4CF8A